LYAGKGKFSDNTVGSPLLALKTILNSKNILSSFYKVNCFFSEADSVNADELYTHTKQLIKSANITNLEIFIRQGAWSYTDKKLNELLQYSTWGLVFIDPFANEIELDNLFPLIKEKCKTIDFMLFVNTQSLKRIAGLKSQNTQIANFLGVNADEINDIVKDNSLIRQALQNRFEASGKEYILNASIPTSRNDKLTHSDNFQLILGTNSIGVSDAFLVSYMESLKLFKTDIPLDLFNTLENNISVIIKEFNELTINKIVQELYKNNNSWKYADLYNLPTIDNIYIAINKLIKGRSISFQAPEAYINKNGTLTKATFKKNSRMKEILIKKNLIT